MDGSEYGFMGLIFSSLLTHGFDRIGLVFSTVTSIFSLLTITDWHREQTGATENVKLSLIQPLQSSAEQDHMAVISSGTSSCGFLRE